MLFAEDNVDVFRSGFSDDVADGEDGGVVGVGLGVRHCAISY